jgi:hypothetical protein
MGNTSSDTDVCDIAIKACLSEIGDRLERAGSISKAAQACAEAGNIRKAIEIVLDLEQIVYETTTFLNAASMMNRIWNTDRQ